MGSPLIQQVGLQSAGYYSPYNKAQNTYNANPAFQGYTAKSSTPSDSFTSRSNNTSANANREGYASRFLNLNKGFDIV